MEEIRSAALAYHSRLSAEEKQLAEKLFESLDVKRDGKIGFQAFRAKFANEAQHEKCITDPRFFKNLDRDKDGFLDKQDVITLSYLVNTGKVFSCNSCGDFVTGLYFVCLTCFNRSTGSPVFYKLCSSCHNSGTFDHHEDAKFVDNDSLLMIKRSQPGQMKHTLDPQIIMAALLVASIKRLVAEPAQLLLNEISSDAASSADADPSAFATDPQSTGSCTDGFASSDSDITTSISDGSNSVVDFFLSLIS